MSDNSVKFIYVDKYRGLEDNFEGEGFQINFGSDYIYAINKMKNQLGKTSYQLNELINRDYSKSFFIYPKDSSGFEINNISGIIGENTSGKTRVLKLISELLETVYRVDLHKTYSKQNNASIEEELSFCNFDRFAIVVGNSCYHNFRTVLSAENGTLNCFSVYDDVKLPPTKRVLYLSSTFDFYESNINSLSRSDNMSVNHVIKNSFEDYKKLNIHKRNPIFDKSTELKTSVFHIISSNRPQIEKVFSNYKVSMDTTDKYYLTKLFSINKLGIKPINIDKSRCIEVWTELEYGEPCSILLKAFLKYFNNMFYGYELKQEEWFDKTKSNIKDLPLTNSNNVVQESIKVFSDIIDYLLSFIESKGNKELKKLGINSAGKETIKKVIVSKIEKIISFYKSGCIENSFCCYDQSEQAFIFDIHNNKEKSLYSNFTEKINQYLGFLDIEIFRYTHYKNTNEVFFSSGEMMLLYQFGMLSKVVGSKNNIMLLIDEGEMYLHPKWKLQYLKTIIIFLNILYNCETKPYKNVQIVFATNSPFLITELPPSNVIQLGVEAKNLETYASNIQTLLTDSFFLERFIGDIAYDKIREISEYLKGDIFDEEKNKQYSKVISLIGEPILKDILRQRMNEFIDKLDDDVKKEEYYNDMISYYETKKEALKESGGSDD